jgi:hypothetical protein
MSKSKPDLSEETLQVGVTPVQAFSTPVIRPDQENPPQLRQGRPGRVIPAKPPQSVEIGGDAQAVT